MLVTSRTPLRVSFFGGGTDYPEYFRRARGAVVGMAIDRYIYLAALRLTNTLDYRYRLSYSRVETVKSAAEIQHPLVRTALLHFEIDEPLDISVMADLPARSGLGSSSSFAVGFVNLLTSLRRRQITKLDLARQAVFIERELLHQNVGVQDQYHAAFGGLNRFDFEGERTRISPVQMTGECLAALNASLFLVYTGVTRFASATLDEQMERTRAGSVDRDLSHLLLLTGQAVDVLEGADPERMLKEFGAMLHEGWETKKRLSSKVSNPAIDAMYAAARDEGAFGGKLCGAGSGGFLLMLVPPERQGRFHERFGDAGIIRVNIDTIGSTILSN